MSEEKKAVKAREVELHENVIKIGRVTTVVKGGRRFSLTATVVMGDQAGVVGYGYGKAREVPAAIKKAKGQAMRHLRKVSLVRGNLPHDATAKFKGSLVLIKRAAPGTGIIAGGAVRAVLQAAGVANVLAKSKGSNNPQNLAKATLKALYSLEDVRDVAKRRHITVEKIFNG